MALRLAQKLASLLLPAGVILALILVNACGGSYTAPPPASADLGGPMEVTRQAGQGWQGDLAFGGYRVHAIQGEKPVQGDWRFVGMKGLVMRQAASFVVSGGGGGDWYCRCALGSDSGGMDLNIGTLWGHGFTLDPSRSQVLACVMNPSQGGKTWRMSIYSLPSKWRDAGKDPNAAGALSDGISLTIRIKGKGEMSVEEVGGGRPPVYKFLGDAGELAQVQVLAPQRVWLPQGQLRAPLAAAAGAILVGHGDGPKK